MKKLISLLTMATLLNINVTPASSLVSNERSWREPLRGARLSSLPYMIAQNLQSTTLVDNTNPSQCNFLKNNQLLDQCDRFRLARLEDQEGRSFFMMTFYFKNAHVTYTAYPFVEDTFERNGKTFNVYEVALRLLERRGYEPQSSSTNEGVCAIDTNNREVACGISNFMYIYTN